MNPPNRTLIYRVSRNGHVMGEYDIDRIVELLDSGEFLWTDLCWVQGMAAWAPLSNLRAEVAAVKAFPPVAAMPTPVASGRRRMQAPVAQVATTQAAAPSVAGWMWIVGGVTLGALVGLLTAHLFPNVVTVDRPVEKIVEKPVEVIRTVEKRVEIPARLTPEQIAAEVFYRRFKDFNQHKKGSPLLKVSDRVKVFILITGSGKNAVSEGLVRAKVESAFRSQGFKVLSDDSKEYPFSGIEVKGTIVQTDAGPVAGNYAIEISQSISYMDSFDEATPENLVIKSNDITLYRKGGVFYYGNQHFDDIIKSYDKTAQEAAGELRRAIDN